MGPEMIPSEVFKDMLGKIGVEVLFKGSDLFFRSVRERFVKTPRPRRDDLIVALTAQLDELVHDLAPAFQVGSDTALVNLIFRVHPEQDHQWRGVHMNLTILTAWFQRWNAQRKAFRTIQSAEVLVNQIEELTDVVMFTSWAGEEISKWVQTSRPDEYGYQNFKVASQRFDLFLTKFESFLRKLPRDSDFEERFFPPGGPLFKRMSL
jgi:hypothetical protein